MQATSLVAVSDSVTSAEAHKRIMLRIGHGVQGGLCSPNDIVLGDKVEVETSTLADDTKGSDALTVNIKPPRQEKRNSAHAVQSICRGLST